MSSLINKVKESISGGSSSTNAGPHNSNLANQADPRIDSDMDHRGNPARSTGGYGSHPTTGTGTTGYGSTGHPTAGASGIGGVGSTGQHSTTGGYGGSTNAGPHNSNLMNKLDPRVDSDMDNRGNPASSTGGYGSHPTAGTGASGYGSAGQHSTTQGYGGSTNVGPHDSNLMNKLDPRVDSDMDNRGNPTSNVGGYGSHPTAGTGSTGMGGVGGTTHRTTTTTTTGGYDGSTNAGPHNSNLMNKLDPRVDSDMDNRGNPTSNVGGYGNHHTTGAGTAGHTGHTAGGVGTTGQHSTTSGYGGSTNAGPHDSNFMNKADPRVDSDRDHRGNPGSATGGYGSAHSATTTGTSGYGHTGTSGYGSGATPGSGNAPNTAGPHGSDLMNKLDPRVDSDLDGSKTYGGNATHR